MSLSKADKIAIATLMAPMYAHTLMPVEKRFESYLTALEKCRRVKKKHRREQGQKNLGRAVFGDVDGGGA